MKVSDEFLTFPVTVTRALTSFEDVKSMTETLAGAEYPITNVKYILSGYVNGTASSSKYPTSVSFNSKVGGKKGFIDLVKYANEKGIEVMPNFDFANVRRTNWGFSLKKHGALMMSDRYATKRSYDAVYQSISRRGFANIVSTTAYDYIYTKFSKSYDKFFTSFESVGYNGSLAALTLGTDLNSDFNRDNPITREESKQNTTKLLKNLSGHYDSLVVEGGNAYTIPYADAILSVPLDNSNYAISSAAIPFIGMVLHGSKYISGSPINMEGDINSAILKAIENGSSLYFVLSKQNTSLLKEDFTLSSYYSVSYDIWKNDVVEYYTILNDVTKDLQTSYIVDHEFLFAERVPDADELAADAAALKQAEEEAKRAEEEKLAQQEREKLFAQLHGLPYEEPAETPVVEPEDEIVGEETTEEEVTVEETTGEYEKTKYTTTSGTVVRVEYEGGVNFLLNYNSFDITVKYNGQTYEIEALGFVRIG
jgi:hypothetical protein